MKYHETSKLKPECLVHIKNIHLEKILYTIDDEVLPITVLSISVMKN